MRLILHQSQFAADPVFVSGYGKPEVEKQPSFNARECKRSVCHQILCVDFKNVK